MIVSLTVFDSRTVHERIEEEKMRSIVAFLFIATLFSCTNESGARKTLEGAGYTDIEFHGHAYGRCGDDSSCTEFTATGPTGKRVHGAVGCANIDTGCSKGCTIRTF